MMRSRRRAARDRRPVSSASIGFASTACSGGFGFGPITLDRGSVLLTLITHQHLVAQLTPDRLVDLCESWLKADLRHVPGPRQIDLVGALDRSRSGGEEDYAIGERDRFLEVVRDEHHRRRRR